MADRKDDIKSQRDRSRSLDRAQKTIQEALHIQQAKRKKLNESDNMEDTGEEENTSVQLKILNAITEMNQSIQTAVLSNISLLTEKQVATGKKVEEHESALNEHESQITQLKSENEDLRYRLSLSEARSERLEQTLDQLKEEVLNINSRSMRDNLVFQNIKDVEDETSEQTKAKLLTFMETTLKVKNAKQVINVDRVHRMGKKFQNKDRPIVAHFTDSTSKETVQKQGPKLKDTNYYMNEQYPAEIEERRRKCRQQKKEVLEKNADAKCFIRYDKLYVNGQLYRDLQEEKFTFSSYDVTKSKDIEVVSSDSVTAEGSVFQGFAARIDNPDQVKPAILKLFSDHKLTSRATHVTYAYRVRYKGRFMENFGDDGEPGAGKSIFNIMQGRNIERGHRDGSQMVRWQTSEQGPLGLL